MFKSQLYLQKHLCPACHVLCAGCWQCKGEQPCSCSGRECVDVGNSVQGRALGAQRWNRRNSTLDWAWSDSRGGISCPWKWISLKKDQLKVERGGVVPSRCLLCSSHSQPYILWLPHHHYICVCAVPHLLCCSSFCCSVIRDATLPVRVRSNWLHFCCYGPWEVCFSLHEVFTLWCFWLWTLSLPELCISFVSHSLVVLLFFSVTHCIWIYFCSFPWIFL